MSVARAATTRATPSNHSTTPSDKTLPLRQMTANMSLRRAPERTPGRKEAGRTPTGPLSARRHIRYTPGKIVKPTTPHGIRAFEQRRAGALTPGRNKRRSGRIQRETPRDLLRALSRVMPRPEPAPGKENLPPPAEDEESEDEISLPSPRLSFGVHEDEKTLQQLPRSARFSVERGRRATDMSRLSMDASIMVGDIGDSDAEDDDAPTTKLLDESLTGSDLSIPEPTFGEKDNFGDTIALNQLRALARSPSSPENGHGPLTPTADMSFVLDIPAFTEPSVQVADDEDFDDVLSGGFELPDADMDELTANPRDFTPSTVSQKAAADLGTINHPLLDAAKRAALPTKAGKSKKTKARSSSCLSKGVVKRVATSFLRSPSGKTSRLKKGALDAIITASDWFFEQVSEDVAAYAEHAGRKKIDESDALMLVRRQRLLGKKSTLFSLAQKHLSGELLKDIRTIQKADSA